MSRDVVADRHQPVQGLDLAHGAVQGEVSDQQIEFDPTAFDITRGPENRRGAQQIGELHTQLQRNHAALAVTEVVDGPEPQFLDDIGIVGSELRDGYPLARSAVTIALPNMVQQIHPPPASGKPVSDLLKHIDVHEQRRDAHGRRAVGRSGDRIGHR